MLDQDLDADADQDEAADDLHALAEERSEAPAEVQADGGEDEGDDADHDRRIPDLDAEERQGQAHGERVDARRHGEHDERRPARGVLRGALLLVAPDRLVDHVAADGDQEAEGDPVVEPLIQRRPTGPRASR